MPRKKKEVPVVEEVVEQHNCDECEANGDCPIQELKEEFSPMNAHTPEEKEEAMKALAEHADEIKEKIEKIKKKLKWEMFWYTVQTAVKVFIMIIACLLAIAGKFEQATFNLLLVILLEITEKSAPRATKQPIVVEIPRKK